MQVMFRNYYYQALFRALYCSRLVGAGACLSCLMFAPRRQAVVVARGRTRRACDSRRGWRMTCLIVGGYLCIVL